MFKLCYVIAELPATARATAMALPALLAAFRRGFFAPFHISLWREDPRAPMCIGPTPIGELWPGETKVPSSPLSIVDPSGADRVLAELGDALGGGSITHTRLEGALWHEPPNAPAPAWHGHWTPHAGLPWQLISISIEGEAARRRLELSFPLSGYPLTASRLLRNGRMGNGGRRSAARNRGRLARALGAVAPAFGVDPAKISWTTEGDYSGLYPDDADALHATVTALATPPPPHQNDEDITFVLGSLITAASDDRALTLRNLISQPTRDRRVAEALTALLDDASPVLMSIPPTFGELRLLAAQALAAERRAICDRRAVELTCTAPQTAAQLAHAMSALGVPWPRGDLYDAGRTALAELLRRHALPQQTFRLGG